MVRTGLWRRLAIASVVLTALMLALAALGRPAGEDKRLDRIKGQVGYATDPGAPLHQVFGHEVIPDDDYAITRAKSAAEIALPDSSIVSLGENTEVRVGAFSTGVDGPGSTIAVVGGSLRFDIRRPAGGTANYHFTTTTSQIAVRGTVGLLSFLGGNTTVACLSCAADSVTITTGTQTITLVTGQLVTISATGAIVTGTVTSTALSSFSGAEVSTSAATGPSGAVAGIGGAASTGVATGTVAAAAAGAAAVGATAAIVSANSSPAPAPSASFSPAPAVSPTPSPSPTPNAPIQIQRLSAPAIATAAPAAPHAAPTPAPPVGPPGGLPGEAAGRRSVR